MKLQRWHKRDIVIFFACLLFVALVVNKHLANMLSQSPGATIFGLVVCAFVFPFLPVRAVIFGYGRLRKWRNNRKGGEIE